MRISLKYQDGFSLIELLAVLAILSIITAIAMPLVFASIENARIAADQASVRTLNSITSLLRMTPSNTHPFEDETKSNEELMQLLVDEGYLALGVTPQSKDATFAWIFEDEKWYLMFEDSFYVITLADGFSLVNGRLSGSYLGEPKDVVIPISIDGNPIKYIYQDTFRNKGMIAVSFEVNSQVERIHARAFYGNSLAHIDFPDTVQRIDLWSFKNNNLIGITLPPNLHIIEQQAFNGNDLNRITIGAYVTDIQTLAFGEYTEQFIEAYQIGGAGTYSLIGEIWVK